MIGQTLSHYRIVAPLGSGGMGVVYEAEDTRLRRRVALKLLPQEAYADPVAMERFLREARIISSLSHPHICVLHDIGEHQGQQFMVMELLEGESLKERLARGALPLDMVLEIGEQIADALDAAHAQGVVHRDIKAANLFVTRRAQVKVLDFGVAKLGEVGVSKDDLADTRVSQDLTSVGSAIGTVGYMSPEQARGEDIDARSDLFSFGIVLYEMAAGRVPFPGPTSAVVFEGILTKTPPPPSTLNANVPPELDRIIAKALERNREIRYQTAADMRADLKRLRRDTESGRTSTTAIAPPVPEVTVAVPAAVQPPPTAAAPRARRAWLVGAPLATVAIVGAALVWQSTRAPALTSRDTVVLSHFVNRTGDAVFDDTLVEALALQLRQSPFLNLLSDQRVEATLRLMGRDPASDVTPELGRDLCQRVGGKALLGGTIAGLGSRYVVTLTAQDCVTGDMLAEEQAQATGKEDVIRALGSAASAFRERLGESLPSIQRYDARIEQATTPSLDALKAYSQGMTARRAEGEFESIPFFKRAIELDPKFALAHARLGTVYTNLGNHEASRVHTSRAYELRDKVSERERLYIEARYFTTIGRDPDRAIECYRLLLAMYPTDFAALTNLGSLYKQKGRTTDAIANLEESVRLGPDQPLGWFNLGHAYFEAGRHDDARRTLEQTVKVHDGTSARAGLYMLAVLAGDQALAQAQLVAVRGRRDEYEMTSAQLHAALYHGRLQAAQALADEMQRRVEGAGRQATSGEFFIVAAVAQAVAGRDRAARAEFARVQQSGMATDGISDEVVALAAVLGGAQLSRAWLDKALAYMRQTAPVNDLPNLEKRVRALDALAGGRYDEARTLMAPSAADGRDYQAQFALGMANLQAGRHADAATAFREMLARRPQMGLSPYVALGYFHLGRAEAATGSVAAARAAYEEGFKIWKDADADVPALVRARAEYAKLGT
jgi:eukaryotic-like serine/threonine-protein kinase